MFRPLEERIKLSQSLREDFPKSIPTIVQRSDTETSLQQIDKRHFLVPQDMTLGNLVGIIAARLGIYSNNSLWMYASRYPLTNRSETMTEIYNRFRETDGFLYLTYKGQESFG